MGKYTFRKYLSRHFSPLGEVIRIDGVKIANEVRSYAGTRHRFIAYPIRVDVTKMRIGEWGMGNGKWGMGNGKWGMRNEK